jgi:acylphosphatase
MNSKQLTLKIFGEVQGVGFRFFVIQTAQKLNLVGYCRNEKNNTVTVVAEGDEENLKKLLQSCEKGPYFARVDNIEKIWQDATNQFSEFTIN